MSLVAPALRDRARVVVVDDDVRLGQLIVEYITSTEIEATLVPRSDVALELILSNPPDLVILDLMMPGLNGFDLIRRVRPRYDGLILVQTARRSDTDHVVGLELGADDYVTKPLDPRVLLARAQALLRRARRHPPGDAIASRVELGALVVDQALREVRFGGATVPLTSTEFDLLAMLAAHAGRTVGRDLLYRALRGIEYDGLDRGMDIHVSRIRRKLVVAGAPPGLLKSVRSLGYQLAAR